MYMAHTNDKDLVCEKEVLDYLQNNRKNNISYALTSGLIDLLIDWLIGKCLYAVSEIFQQRERERERERERGGEERGRERQSNRQTDAENRRPFIQYVVKSTSVSRSEAIGTLMYVLSIEITVDSAVMKFSSWLVIKGMN